MKIIYYLFTYLILLLCDTYKTVNNCKTFLKEKFWKILPVILVDYLLWFTTHQFLAFLKFKTN